MTNLMGIEKIARIVMFSHFFSCPKLKCFYISYSEKNPTLYHPENQTVHVKNIERLLKTRKRISKSAIFFKKILGVLRFLQNYKSGFCLKIEDFNSLVCRGGLSIKS